MTSAALPRCSTSCCRSSGASNDAVRGVIAVSSSGRTFRALAQYLALGRGGDAPERVAWSAGRHLPSDEPTLAAVLMRATAQQSDRVAKPVYHIALSFAPEDQVDRRQMEQVADRLLAHLGLSEHQALLVAHRDRTHRHLHILVNRVHPETGRAWERWKDHVAIQEFLRAEERALGLRAVAGTLGRPHLAIASPEPEQATTSPVDASREHTQDRESGAARRTVVEELVHALAVRARAGALERDELDAEAALSAARALERELDTAAERARRALDAFASARERHYRDPAAALHAFERRIAAVGLERAAGELASTPGRFGELAIAVNRGSMWKRRPVEPNAGPELSAAAVSALEALRRFGAVAARLEQRRAEHDLSQILGTLFADPAGARERLRAHTASQGIDRTALLLSNEPATFGRLAGGAPAESERRALCSTAADALRRAEHSAEVVASLDRRVLEAAHARAAGHAHEQLAAAAAHVARLRRERDTLPAKDQLARQITTLALRLAPGEIRRLRVLITAPDAAFIYSLRRAAREIATGREVEG